MNTPYTSADVDTLAHSYNADTVEVIKWMLDNDFTTNPGLYRFCYNNLVVYTNSYTHAPVGLTVHVKRSVDKRFQSAQNAIAYLKERMIEVDAEAKIDERKRLAAKAAAQLKADRLKAEADKLNVVLNLDFTYGSVLASLPTGTKDADGDDEEISVMLSDSGELYTTLKINGLATSTVPLPVAIEVLKLINKYNA